MAGRRAVPHTDGMKLAVRIALAVVIVLLLTVGALALWFSLAFRNFTF